MRYVSTRGRVKPLGFMDAVLMGMADDGGLLIPEDIPRVEPSTLDRWSHLSYPALAFEILSLYVGEEVPAADLKRLIENSYGVFRDPQVTPVRRLGNRRYVLELFHGPTFAFKDVALQWLGHLYAYIAENQSAIINILGATSGDTGASAIAGVRGKAGIRICILYPEGKVSRVQELQMTTIRDANVLTLAVDGSFDDCQRIIKDLFRDVAFKRQYHLRAINSINMARILAQAVYYFYAYFRVREYEPSSPVSFSVPTGNFGDIFAGYLAKQMGLPVNSFILATNENNILERFVHEGVYAPTEVRRTHSPSMDIQVASNFERYLYYLSGQDSQMVDALMKTFQQEGRLTVSDALSRQVARDFRAYRVDNAACLDTIEAYYHDYDYLIDPHTACAAKAVDVLAKPDEVAIIVSTAHPAKFDEAVRLRHIQQILPADILALHDGQTVVRRIDGDTEAVKQRLLAFLGGSLSCPKGTSRRGDR